MTTASGPEYDHAVRLGIYDGTGGLVSRLDVPAGAPCSTSSCWKSSGGTFTYRDPDRARAGLGVLRLHEGPRRDSVTATATGPVTPVPTLPLPAPVTIQLRASNGGCWGTVFDDASILRNDAMRFRARAD